MSSVYASGHIIETEAESYAEYIAKLQILINPIQVLSPMRGKDALSGKITHESKLETIKLLELKNDPLAEFIKDGSILNRDMRDVMNCDLLLANLTNNTKVSIGTVCEIAWAHYIRKPVVLIFPPEGEPNPHDHLFLTYNAIAKVRSIEDAAKIINITLCNQPPLLRAITQKMLGRGYGEKK